MEKVDALLDESASGLSELLHKISARHPKSVTNKFRRAAPNRVFAK
jgi:hypothetical protein